MAQTLRRLSRYPFVVIAELADARLGGLPAAVALAKLGAHVLPPASLLAAHERGVDLGGGRGAEYLRLYVWGLTQFDKVIWLDAETVLFRSIDALFDEPAPLSWREEVACPAASNRTAALLVRPRHADLVRLAALSAQRGDEAADGGVDALLGHYFGGAFPGFPSNGSSVEEPWAASGSCLYGGLGACSCADHYRQHHGFLRHPMPAIIFGAAAGADCFSFAGEDSDRRLHGTEACQHPAVLQWRDDLCRAARLLPQWPPELRAFCSDARCFAAGEHATLDTTVLSDIQICNFTAVGSEVMRESPVYFSSPEANNKCFAQLAALHTFSAKPGFDDRNWCWVGLKEYGCHATLWRHLSWSEMHLVAVGAGGTAPLPEFSPLARGEVCDRQFPGASPNATDAEVQAAHDWFSKHVAVYVLSLKTSTDRRATFREHLGRLNIPFEVVWGLDLHTPEAQAAARRDGLIPAAFDLDEAQRLAVSDENVMGPILGTLGCAAAHLRAQSVAARATPRRPISLIFEDDVLPVEDFVVRVWKLVTEEVPCDWQVVSLRTGCPYGTCVSPRLSRVSPDVNEPERRCRHGVNYGFQGMMYRTSELMSIHEALFAQVFDAKRPHCLDVDVALASLSDSVRYYAVPAVQDPGFLKETGATSARAAINYNKPLDP